MTVLVLSLLELNNLETETRRTVHLRSPTRLYSALQRPHERRLTYKYDSPGTKKESNYGQRHKGRKLRTARLSVASENGKKDEQQSPLSTDSDDDGVRIDQGMQGTIKIVWIFCLSIDIGTRLGARLRLS